MSVFRDVLIFLDGIGLYDVILPLLLIFTIVYAILDKTKLLGVEKIGGEEVPRKNINSMVAFVTAFFFVASSQLVATINALVSQVALVIVIFVMFMIMMGAFTKKGDLDDEQNEGWRKVFMIIAFVSIILIFLNALGWLMPMWYWLVNNWSSTVAITAIMIGGMALMILWITKTPENGNNSSGGEG